MKTETFQVGGGGMPELCFSDNDFDRIPDCRYVAVFNVYLFDCSFLCYFLILGSALHSMVWELVIAMNLFLCSLC
jgi:hypothetical protein